MKPGLRIAKSTKFITSVILIVSIACVTLYAYVLSGSSIILRPDGCFFGLPFLNERTMQTIIMAISWDAQFSIGEIQVQSQFAQDAYGCLKPRTDGKTEIGLIVLGPSLIIEKVNPHK